MDVLWQDVRYAFRSFLRAPGFTLVAVATLALGLGVNSAMFSAVNAVLLQPPAVKEPDRLVAISGGGEMAFLETEFEALPYPDYRDYAAQTDIFSGLLAYKRTPAVLGRGDQGEMALGEAVTANYFDVLGVSASRGRVMRAGEDDRPGATPVVVLSHSIWQRRFGSDPTMLSRTVDVAGISRTVIGIAPEEFTGLFRGVLPDFWIPLTGSGTAADVLEDRGNPQVWVVGRLRPGVTMSQARVTVDTVARRLALAYPETNRTRHVGIIAGRDLPVHPAVSRKTLGAASLALLAQTGLILLIACANLANLFLARATQRRKEIAVRLSLGASRTRLFRQLLTESTLLAGIGGAVALVLAAWLGQLLNTMQLPLPVRVGLGLRVDATVAFFTLGLALLTGVVFGLVPAIRALSPDIYPVLKDAASGLGGRPQARLRHALVIGEVAVSLALLVLAGLSLRSLANAHSIDPGFDANGVVVASLDPGLAGRDAPTARRFIDRFNERLRLVPGVEAVSTVQPIPLSLNIRVNRLRTDADQARPAKDLPFIDTAIVGPDYFRALRIDIVAGREFLGTDEESHQRVAVVNETMARQYWPNGSPLGRRVAVGFPQPTPVEIVGVVRDTKSRTLGDQARPFIYTCARQDPMGWQSATIVVRTRGNSQEIGQSIRTIVHQLDPEMPVYGIQSLADRIGVAYALPRYALTLFGAFAGLALLLACVGLYGVVAYAVSQRTREIGLRMAFGADRARIFRLIVGEALWLGGTGVLVGAPIAFVLSRAASAFLYGVGAFDPLTLAGTATLMVFICCLAAYMPARRAASIDPMVALRYE